MAAGATMICKINITDRLAIPVKLSSLIILSIAPVLLAQLCMWSMRVRIRSRVSVLITWQLPVRESTSASASASASASCCRCIWNNTLWLDLCSILANFFGSFRCFVRMFGSLINDLLTYFCGPFDNGFCFPGVIDCIGRIYASSCCLGSRCCPPRKGNHRGGRKRCAGIITAAQANQRIGAVGDFTYARNQTYPVKHQLRTVEDAAAVLCPEAFFFFRLGLGRRVCLFRRYRICAGLAHDLAKGVAVSGDARHNYSPFIQNKSSWRRMGFPSTLTVELLPLG